MSYFYHIPQTGLNINFNEADYSTDESDITGLSGISLSLRETQAPFRMELIPATIEMAETLYGLTDFLDLGEIGDEQRAKSGKIHVYACYSLCKLQHTYIACTHKNFMNSQMLISVIFT